MLGDEWRCLGGTGSAPPARPDQTPGARHWYEPQKKGLTLGPDHDSVVWHQTRLGAPMYAGCWSIV